MLVSVVLLSGLSGTNRYLSYLRVTMDFSYLTKIEGEIRNIISQRTIYVYRNASIKPPGLISLNQFEGGWGLNQARGGGSGLFRWWVFNR